MKLQKHELDLYDYNIFFILYSNPLASYAEIAREVGLTAATIKERINAMKSANFINEDKEIADPVLGTRLQTEVEIRYNPQSIGLIRQHVIFERIRSYSDLRKIKKFCDDHPYTHFRAEIIGNGLSLYSQFDIPEDIRVMMDNTYQILSNELGIGNIVICNEIEFVEGLPKISNIDTYTGDWKENSIQESLLFDIMEKAKMSISISQLEKNSNEIYKLSDLDAKLLRELTINGKVSITELASNYGVNKSTISRRIRKVMDSVIDRAILNYNTEIFGINTFQLITGHFQDEESKNVCLNFTKSNVLPMRVRISIDDNLQYVIYSAGSSKHTVELSKLIWELSDPISYHSYQIDPKSFMSYYFYHENYDEKEGWNTEKEYSVDIPLNSIK
ncbi:MAG: AsnC family protein [Candidatus Heimdallarchaeota archaeon]|nr:AsnC family protein [Candidatus Heimdallarchaeota archaeon]